jgi:hypothetical protein
VYYDVIVVELGASDRRLAPSDQVCREPFDKVKKGRVDDFIGGEARNSDSFSSGRGGMASEPSHDARSKRAEAVSAPYIFCSLCNLYTVHVHEIPLNQAKEEET